MKGRILLYGGFILAGIAGGFAAKYISHHVTSNGILICLGGIAVAILSFIAYAMLLTKMGK